jgi:hypothetical protein
MCLQLTLLCRPNLYNRATTAKSIIGHFSKIPHFISPALEGGYAKGKERATFSMTA